MRVAAHDRKGIKQGLTEDKFCFVFDGVESDLYLNGRNKAKLYNSPRYSGTFFK